MVAMLELSDFNAASCAGDNCGVRIPDEINVSRLQQTQSKTISHLELKLFQIDQAILNVIKEGAC